MILSGRFYDCVILTLRGLVIKHRTFATSANDAFDSIWAEYSVIYKLATIEVKEYVS